MQYYFKVKQNLEVLTPMTAYIPGLAAGGLPAIGRVLISLPC
jgi:hypothetical protein